jgi:hypothetical protein
MYADPYGLRRTASLIGGGGGGRGNHIPSKQKLAHHLKIGRVRFLPNPFQLIIHNHPAIQCYTSVHGKKEM